MMKVWQPQTWGRHLGPLPPNLGRSEVRTGVTRHGSKRLQVQRTFGAVMMDLARIHGSIWSCQEGQWWLAIKIRLYKMVFSISWSDPSQADLVLKIGGCLDNQDGGMIFRFKSAASHGSGSGLRPGEPTCVLMGICSASFTYIYIHIYICVCVCVNTCIYIYLAVHLIVLK